MRSLKLPLIILVGVYVIALMCMLGCDTITFDLTKPTFVTTTPTPETTLTVEPALQKTTVSETSIYNKVFAITDASKCSKYSWKNRGTAKKSYYRGMGLTYAKAFCSPNNVVSSARGLPESKYDVTDVLSWYNSNFNRIGLRNDISGLETQRHVWALLIGLGMRESSGRYCVGRDLSMNFTTADSAEAGLFQSSWGARKRDPSMVTLFNSYQTNRKGCFYEVFKEGYFCSAADLKNWGQGDGLKFQELSKTCPAFSAEYAAILVRKSGGTKGEYGPLRTKKAELNKDCDDMLKQIEKVEGICG